VPAANLRSPRVNWRERPQAAGRAGDGEIDRGNAGSRAVRPLGRQGLDVSKNLQPPPQENGESVGPPCHHAGRARQGEAGGSRQDNASLTATFRGKCPGGQGTAAADGSCVGATFSVWPTHSARNRAHEIPPGIGKVRAAPTDGQASCHPIQIRQKKNGYAAIGGMVSILLRPRRCCHVRLFRAGRALQSTCFYHAFRPEFSRFRIPISRSPFSGLPFKTDERPLAVPARTLSLRQSWARGRDASAGRWPRGAESGPVWIDFFSSPPAL